MLYDCDFSKENNRFRYRAAAIIVEDGCVLLVGNEKEDYLYSVGGGVHMNEKAEDADKISPASCGCRLCSHHCALMPSNVSVTVKSIV